MKKKLFILLLIVIIAAPLLLIGCQEEEKLHILTLGDSIAEGIAGMRPVSERERDAYYGVIGIRNGYDFKNRAISGSKTAALLSLIQEEEHGVKMTQSLIRSADIIHVSILGNDLLLSDLGAIIVAAANENYDTLNAILNTATRNFAQIVEKLKEYNSEAVYFFQTVYNPVFGKTVLINEKSEAELAEKGYHEDQYRALTDGILTKLNKIVHDYLAAHPGAYYIMDGQAEFDRIYKENPERGKDLIFVDQVHPSSEGHAVLADLSQAKLEELGLANKKTALKNYKEMRISQLERLYDEVVDVKAYKKQINKAKSCGEVSEIYYNAIEDEMPNYLLNVNGKGDGL